MAKTYTIRVNVLGSDKASKPLNRFGGSLLSLRNIIGGILGANLILALGRQIVGLGRDALNSVATYEQMGFTLQTLIARELARGETLTRVSTQVRALTAHEKLRVMELVESQTALTISLAGVSDAYNDSILKSGENSKASLQLEIRLASLKTQIAVTASELGALSNIETIGLKTLESYTIGTMSMGEALRAAAPMAQEMIKWVENLAIASPFDMKGVTIALRTALAYGMNLDMAKRLTQATVDFAAASGLSGETLTRIARAMGQVQGKGRLMAEEVRQMADAGLPVLAIMGKAYGKTTVEIQALMRKGLIPAHDAINAITASLEGDFAGAAERQLETWNGIRNSMGDIKVMSLQRIFVGITDAFKPFFGTFIDFMRSGGFDALEKFGETFGEGLKIRLDELAEKFRKVKAFFTLADAGMIKSALQMIGIPQYVIDSVDSLEESWGNIKTWWDENKDPLVEAVGNVFKALFPGTENIAQNVWEGAVNAFGALGNFFENDNGKLAKRINELAEAISENLHPALKNFSDWAGTHSTEIGDFLISLSAVIGTFAIISKVEGLAAAFGATGLGGAIAIAAGAPFATVILALGGLAAVVSILYILIRDGNIEAWADWINTNLPGTGEKIAGWWENLSGAYSKDQMITDWAELKEQFGIMVTGIVEYLESGWTSLIEGIETWWTDFKAGFSETVVGGLQEWLDTLGITEIFATAGENWMAGLYNGMKDYWNETVWPWIQEMAQKAMDAWNNFWKMGSPSQLMAESGKNIMAGLMQGLESMDDLPGIHMENVMNTMIDPVNTLPLSATTGLLPSSVANKTESSTSTMTKVEKLIFDFKDTTLTKRELERILTQLGMLNATA